MSNNTTITGGDVIADEDVNLAGVKYQQIKMISALTGSKTPIQDDGNGNLLVSIIDFKAAIENALEMMINPMWQNTNSQLRMSIEAISGGLTLSTVTTVGTVTTVTTVSTVTTLSQIGAVPANSFIFDTMLGCWANQLRGRIT